MFRHCLIVGERPAVRDRLAEALRERGLSVTLAGTAEEALLVVENVAVDVVLVDGTPAGMRLETLRRRVEDGRPGCRVVGVTSLSGLKGTAGMLRLAEDDFVLGPLDLARLLPGPAGDDAAEAAAGRERGVASALLGVIDVLVGLLEMRERYFGGSSHQAMRLARAVAEQLAVDPETPDEVALAALLRDIGRADVPEGVLETEGALSEEQRAMVRAHVESGVRLLESVDFPWKVIPVIRHHHERYDGRGYPDGLRGREIPIGARILAVVDAFLSMISDRPHRKALPVGDVLQELIREAGSQFDPEVVEVFLRVAETMYPHRAGSGKYRVLVADPDEKFRDFLCLRLLNEDHEATAVTGPEDALEALLREPYDLVAADVRPGDDRPMRLIEEMRREESLRSVPCVLLSASSDRALRIRALRLGVDDFVSKSLDLEEIVARLDNVLVRESARRVGGPGTKRGLGGSLENLPLAEIVQMLHIGTKTALVSLVSGGRKGKIWIDHGGIRHAKADQLEGEAAFFALLGWKEGSFTVEHGVRTRKSTIDADPMWLVMEGMRRLDEAGAVL